MSTLLDILHQAQRELHCPTCGRAFLLSEIRPRGTHKKGTLTLQVVCSNNHFPVVLMFIPSQPVALDVQPIKKRDVTALDTALATFEGDFVGLWTKSTKGKKEKHS